MKVEFNKEGANLVICPQGRLDSSTAPNLDGLVKEQIAGVENLVFDLAGLDYMSSAGLRIILSAQKIMNKQGLMKIKNVNEFIMEVFELTGFVDILTIE